MAKRRKYKKSSKCPEPFNTLLDIAGGIAMNAIANKMEKKHHYSQKGKINPYKVSAFKIGTGGFNSTEDIVRTGAFLGAIGSFDAEEDTSYPKQKMINVTPEDPIFNQIKYSSAINNKYAWRLNCQDGSEYGVDPYDYETRDEYNEALEEAKAYSTNDDYVNDDLEEKAHDDTTIVSNSPFILCRLSLLSNGQNIFAIPNDMPLKVGDRVIVQLSNNKKEEAIVLSVEQHTSTSAPTDYDILKQTNQIVNKIIGE